MTSSLDDGIVVLRGLGPRVQIAQVEATLRGDMAAGRVEFIKWSFLFRTGQVLAITGILAVMLRFVRPEGESGE